MATATKLEDPQRPPDAPPPPGEQAALAALNRPTKRASPPAPPNSGPGAIQWQPGTPPLVVHADSATVTIRDPAVTRRVDLPHGIYLRCAALHHTTLDMTSPINA